MNYSIEKVNPRTFRIENGFVRFFLLIGSEKAAMIDSGVSCPEAGTLAAQLTALPAILINTHGDGDHTSGNGSFPAYYMHPADASGCSLTEKFPDSTCIPLEDGAVIDLGGRPLEIVHIPGHTSGSVAILDVNERTLYSGDTVQDGTIYMFGGHRSPEDLGSSLRHLAALSSRFDRIFPSHGTPELPADYVQKVLSDWEQVRAGDLTARRENLYGSDVDVYTAAHCGFFCEPRE